jgi:hypothetical protein
MARRRVASTVQRLVKAAFGGGGAIGRHGACRCSTPLSGTYFSITLCPVASTAARQKLWFGLRVDELCNPQVSSILGFGEPPSTPPDALRRCREGRRRAMSFSPTHYGLGRQAADCVQSGRSLPLFAYGKQRCERQRAASGASNSKRRADAAYADHVGLACHPRRRAGHNDDPVAVGDASAVG